MWGKARSRLIRLVGSVLQFVTKYPTFQVRAGATLAGANGGCRFRLYPTAALWYSVLVGVLVVALPLIRTRALAAAAVVGCAAWLFFLLRRIHSLSLRVRPMLGPRVDYFEFSPYAHYRRAAFVWLPAAAVALSVALLRFGEVCRNGESKSEHISASLTICLVGFIVALVYWVSHRLRRTALAVPALDAWFDSLQTSVKPLVLASTGERRRYPTSSWRRVLDVSREVHTAATALALFGPPTGKPVWQQSVQFVLWYFAPIVIPLFALFLLPLLWNAVIPLGLVEKGHFKAWLTTSALTWAAWSISYFASAGTRDFLRPSTFPHIVPTALAESISFPNGHLRRVASDYFRGTGAAVFTLVAIAIVPAYWGFLGVVL